MTILSVANLRLLQNVSIHKTDEPLISSIEVTENEFVKKYYGDSVFVYILENINVSPTNTFIDLLLDGGFYEDASSPPKKYYINGLTKAIALLTYCDLLLKQTIVTRYGSKNKTDQYSNEPSFDNILEQVNRYRTSALSYLKDIDSLLINIDTTDLEADVQELLTAYRELNCNKVKDFSLPF